MAVDADDLEQGRLAGLQNLTGLQLWRANHLADVQQPLNPQVQLDESTEIQDARHAPLDQLPNPVLLVHQRPGIGQELLQTQGNALALLIDVEHIDVHFLADPEHVTGVVHPFPAYLRDVDQAVSASQVNEGPEAGDVRHLPVPGLSLGEFVHHLFALQLLPRPQGSPLGEDQAAPVAVHLDHPEPDLPADHRLEPLAAFVLREPSGHPDDLRGRDEAANLAVLDDQASTVEARDHATVGLAARQQLFSLHPVLIQPRLLKGQRGLTLPVLSANDEDGHLSADHDAGTVLIVEAVQVCGWDVALSFVAAVHEHTALIDLDDDTRAKVSAGGCLVVELIGQVLIQVLVRHARFR